MIWPNDVLIEETEFFNADPRMTGNPVTPIDIVGGRRWIVRRNFIHDFQKLGADQVSYAAFLKGNSRDGLFEGNIVACHWTGSDTGGFRVGLSFGGGGSSPNSICEDSDCSIEHQNGRMVNNLIVNCSDVGIYLNEAMNCQVHHNTIYTLDDAFGIDVRFVASTVELKNNLLNGPIRERDQGTAILGTNLERVGRTALEAWFTDPGNFDFGLFGDGSSFIDRGETGAGVVSDFCGNGRSAVPDIGAVEYLLDVCSTNSWLPLLIPPSSIPPTGPGPSLRLAKLNGGGRLRLRWVRAGDGWWNIYRDPDASLVDSRLWTPFVTTPVFTDADPSPGERILFYLVRAVSPCTGVEAD